MVAVPTDSGVTVAEEVDVAARNVPCSAATVATVSLSLVHSHLPPVPKSLAVTWAVNLKGVPFFSMEMFVAPSAVISFPAKVALLTVKV